jgi:hypothetical protein
MGRLRREERSLLQTLTGLLTSWVRGMEDIEVEECETAPIRSRERKEGFPQPWCTAIAYPSLPVRFIQPHPIQTAAGMCFEVAQDPLGRCLRCHHRVRVIASHMHSRQTCGHDAHTPPESLPQDRLIPFGLGEKEAAFEWLGRSYEQHDQSLPYARIDPRFDPAAQNPRFAGLMKILHLPPAP